MTNKPISCAVSPDLRQITVRDGFLYQGSQNFTDADGLYFPPEIIFWLSGFQNPREGLTTDPWNVTIFDEKDDEIYYWQRTDAPTLYFSGVSKPEQIKPTL